MLKILIVEDAQGVAESIGALLTVSYKRIMPAGVPENNPMDFFICRSAYELEQHKRDKVDAILLDLRLTDSNEDSTLEWLDENAEKIPPTIVITEIPCAKHHSSLAVTSLANGAADFFHKERIFTEHGSDALLARIIKVVTLRKRILEKYELRKEESECLQD